MRKSDANRRPLQAVVRIGFSLMWAHLAAVVFGIVFFVALMAARSLVSGVPLPVIMAGPEKLGRWLVVTGIVTVAALLGGCVSALSAVKLGHWRVVVPPLVVLLLVVSGYSNDRNTLGVALFIALSAIPAAVVGAYVGIKLRPHRPDPKPEGS